MPSDPAGYKLEAMEIAKLGHPLCLLNECGDWFEIYQTGQIVVYRRTPPLPWRVREILEEPNPCAAPPDLRACHTCVGCSAFEELSDDDKVMPGLAKECRTYTMKSGG